MIRIGQPKKKKVEFGCPIKNGVVKPKIDVFESDWTTK